MLVGLLKKLGYNAKITETESKISSITNLATNTALTAVESKIRSVSNLVKKINYDAKIPDIESICITIADYNKFTKDIVANRIRNEG